jgi:hypothetical protein
MREMIKLGFHYSPMMKKLIDDIISNKLHGYETVMDFHSMCF